MLPNQRTSNGVNARRAPNTTSQIVTASYLGPGQIGTFAGYVLGETVGTENRWAKTAAGLFYWLGALLPTNVVGLPLLPAPLGPGQRQAGLDGSNGRDDATTAGNLITTLDPGEIGTFNGWKRGQAVNGEDRWLRGAISGSWFWLGGLMPANVDGLPEIIGPNQRRAGVDGSNGRAIPAASGTWVTALDPDEVGTFNGWTHGQSINGEDRWLRGALSGAWFWLGGLTPANVNNLPEVTDGRTIYPTPAAPTYPGASKWAHSSKCDPRTPGSVPRVLVMHYWGKYPSDKTEEWDYFTGWQGPDAGSSPTWQSNTDGSIYEVVPPDGYRPWSTGRLDHQAVTIEAQPATGAPGWTFTNAQYESFAQLFAFAHKRWGIPLQLAEVTGTGSNPTVVKGGITSHKLTPAGVETGTACPGPGMDLNRIITRAAQIAATP